MIKSVKITKRQILKTLNTPSSKGVRLVEPFKSFALKEKLPFKILENSYTENLPETHVKEGDLWFCLEGICAFKYGGKLQNQQERKNPDGSANKNEFVGTKIIDGKETKLTPGDWLWIPPGEPHQHIGTKITRLIIIKIPLN